MINPEDTVQQVIDLARTCALKFFVLDRAVFSGPSTRSPIEPHDSIWDVFKEQFPKNAQISQHSPNHSTILDNLFRTAFGEFICKLWAEHQLSQITIHRNRYLQETHND